MAGKKRLIDAAGLDEKLETLVNKYLDAGRDEVAKDYMFVQTVLLTAPTVDAVEVVHANWELHGDDDDLSGSYYCSNCGFNMDEDEYLEHFSVFRYCPYCGAKMDGDGNGR